MMDDIMNIVLALGGSILLICIILGLWYFCRIMKLDFTLTNVARNKILKRDIKLSPLPRSPMSPLPHHCLLSKADEDEKDIEECRIINNEGYFDTFKTEKREQKHVSENHRDQMKYANNNSIDSESSRHINAILDEIMNKNTKFVQSSKTGYRNTYDHNFDCVSPYVTSESRDL